MKMQWKREVLQNIPAKGEILFKGDDRITPYRGDVVMEGDPDAIVRARDTQDVQEILSYCNAHRIPVTFAGGLTGLTGAAVATEGLVISTEKVERVLDISRDSQGRGIAVAQPGIFLGELKEQVAASGYFYPPDPTSYKEARLGGTVATNATGEDTLLYGPTRHYVRALKVVLANGELLNLRRPDDDSVIDLFVGSEGTLGYLAEISVDLISDLPDWWAGIAFFPSLTAALDFTLEAACSSEVVPRALELLDGQSLDILRKDPDIPEIPELSRAAIYWKQEFRNEQEQERGFAAWMRLLEGVLSEYNAVNLSERTWVAMTDVEKERFREWRHLVPASINEELDHYKAEGGGKVASDWWVPLEHIHEAIDQALHETKKAGLNLIAFGHIGKGHPHLNFLVHNNEERRLAVDLLRRQCERAVRWGGGVAGEHGFGKLFRDLLPIEYSPEKICQLREIKQRYDPHWILGRGNILTVT